MVRVLCGLLPQQMSMPHIEVAGFYAPASQTGGDWYGCHYDEASRIAYFFVGDVTGHGFPSALITGGASGAVSAAVQGLAFGCG